MKSETNQPSSGVPPSIDAVRLRSANSGCWATSVVAVMLGSWRATRRPSLVDDQVRLDEVGAELDRERVAGQRVVGQVAGGAAVSDDERVRLVVGSALLRGARIAATSAAIRVLRNMGLLQGLGMRERSSLRERPV